MKVTVLAENTAKTPDFFAEHGLSLLIKTNDETILFDCGQTDAFIKNAVILGVDLKTVDFCILSHGHYDHGGGLKHFLKINERAKIYLPDKAFDKHYNGYEKYIGLDSTLRDNKRITTISDDVKICEGVTIKRLKTQPFKIDSAGLTVKKDGEFLPDKFDHEQYLSITENEKEYLFSGCTHKGLENVLANFAPDVFIGGFHLSKIVVSTQNNRLDEIADLLKNKPTSFYTCHCTGLPQFEFLKATLKDKLRYLYTGDCVEI